ncbi:MAG: BACON domain-containing protein, partial [Bacteroidales bacterium]|nr:BACON domain-containing protein [Bacteroidales bacterium]
MKTLLKLLALAAAALLCLPASLMAQNISVSTTSLSWSASDTSEQAIHVSADYGVTWTVSVSSSAFIADTSEGEGSDFIHVAPAAQNTGSSPVTAVLTISTGGSSAQVSLSQSAPEVNPTERIALPGNWTLTRTYTNAAGTATFEDITFYDGLGYAEQVVQVGASPSGGKNIVTPVWYDVMRRSDARSYLPYVSNSTSRTEESTSSVLSNQSDWYDANGWSDQGDYAFSEQEYEASPLNRVLKVRKSGKTYSSSENGSKAVQISYGTNAADEVRKLSVGSTGAMSISGTYPAGTLHKVTTTDEDNAVSIVWTDVLGRTVLSRTLLDSDNDPNMDPDDVTYYDTYYVYDDAGHLCWVVTPEGSALLETSDTWPVPTSPNGTSTESSLAQAAARYCYVYTWDGLGRQLSRKIPGKAVEYFVYDHAGRLVMSQDGLQRTAGLWVTCKYDNAGRLVRRALLNSSQGRAYFQSLFESSNTPSAVYPSLGDTVLEVYDYGSYTNASSAGLAFSAVSGVVAATDVDQTRIKGLKTYEKVAILSGTGVPTTFVQRAFYYDQLGRLIQTVESNAMGTVSRYSSGYDFLGNVTASREQHGSDYKTSTFTYDLRGRLLSESSSVNGSVTATMAYAYDPL